MFVVQTSPATYFNHLFLSHTIDTVGMLSCKPESYYCFLRPASPTLLLNVRTSSGASSEAFEGGLKLNWAGGRCDESEAGETPHSTTTRLYCSGDEREETERDGAEDHDAGHGCN